jgi:hypothetical protein
MTLESKVSKITVVPCCICWTSVNLLILKINVSRLKFAII